MKFSFLYYLMCLGLSTSLLAQPTQQIMEPIATLENKNFQDVDRLNLNQKNVFVNEGENRQARCEPVRNLNEKLYPAQLPPPIEKYSEACRKTCWEKEEKCCCQDEEDNWNIWIYPNYFYFGLTEGKGLGFKRDYITFGVFTSPSFLNSSSFQTFIDAKGYCFINGKWAASVGVGTRYLINDWESVLGANIYYDYRRVHQRDLHQIGVGIELLNPYVDLRVNGYIPVGKRNHVDGRLFDFSDYFMAVRRKRVSAWSGVDAEAGAWIKRKYPCDWFGLYFAIGPYYYFREHNHKHHFEGRTHRNTFGGRARLLARICDFVDASINVTYDHVWHTRVNGEILVAIPFDAIGSLFGQSYKKRGRDCCCDTAPCLINQIAIQPVHRNGIIVADKECCWCWNWSGRGGCGYSSDSLPHSRSISLSSFSSCGCRHASRSSSSSH